MAYFECMKRKVYYEVYGEGKPILLLNGIMMSTLSWKIFVDSFKNSKLILVDFFDQGQSEKLDKITYKQDIQVELVKALLDHLAIEKVNLVGISYGGEVALQFAVKYQEKLEKLLIFNTASSTSPWLEDIGRGWIATAKTYDSLAFCKITIPVIYSPNFYKANIDWMKNREKMLTQIFQKPYLDAMIRLIESSEGYDEQDTIKQITVDSLIVGCENDYLTPLHEQIYIHKQIKNSQFVIIPECGHASMYEKPNLFISLVLGFINNEKNISVL